jgi:hypothetical protein
VHAHPAPYIWLLLTPLPPLARAAVRPLCPTSVQIFRYDGEEWLNVISRDNAHIALPPATARALPPSPVLSVLVDPPLALWYAPTEWVRLCTLPELQF